MHRISLGDFELTHFSDGNYFLDGGAFFGVVPKVLWARTVTADAGKTMQINLISRNPNLYFRVLPADSRKPLVDTMTSGATTWTTKPETNETYTVRVYQDPSTVASGDVTKYALQVGIY